MKYGLISFLIFYSTVAFAVSISVKNAALNSHLYFASYYGAGIHLVDSMQLVGGEALWVREVPLEEGIYFMTSGPNGERFEFLVGADQEFELEMDDLNFREGAVTGADESEAFRAYQKVVQDPHKSKEEKVAYTRSLCESATEGSVLQLILRAMLPPAMRELSSSLLIVNNGNASDYNALHFWDNYDLSDQRLMRTPFFVPRVEMYLRQVLPPREDKIMEGMLPLLEKVEQNDELLKVVASAALNFAVENSIMGIDALGYEVISRYYLAGRFGTLTNKQQKMLEDYVRHTEYCCIGHKAKEIRLAALDKEKGQVSLYAVEAPYVLVLFWEPDCAYCEVLLPALRNGVFAKYQDQGLQVFAVNTLDDYEMWKNYIVENELFDWHHGYKATETSHFMTDYGIQGTPFMYILDKDKTIVAKNVKLEHLDLMLERLFSSGSIY